MKHCSETDMKQFQKVRHQHRELGRKNTTSLHASEMSNNYPCRHQVYKKMSYCSRWFEKQDFRAENPPRIEDKYSRCDTGEAGIQEQTASDCLTPSLQ